MPTVTHARTQRTIANARHHGARSIVQADGLEIEAAAKRRLADEYDAAQAAGEIKAPNNAKTNSKPEAVSATAIGLTHKQVHDARQLRDAEQRDPCSNSN